MMAVRVWARSTPRRRCRNRRDDPPVGTGRSPLSARWLRSWPPGSRPGRVSVPASVSAHGEHGTALPGRRVPRSTCGFNGLHSSGRIAHGGSRVRWPVIGRGYGGGPRLGQRARGTRVPCRTRDLHRDSGLARGLRQRWRRERRDPGFPAASRKHQSGRSRRVGPRERGECRRVVGHNSYEPNRRLRAGGRFDHRRREHRREHTRSGRRRAERITTANCRLVASGLRPLGLAWPTFTVARNSALREQLARRTTLRQPRETLRE